MGIALSVCTGCLGGLMKVLDDYSAYRLRERLGRISELGMSALFLAVMLWTAGCKKGEAPAPNTVNQPAANQPQAESQAPAPTQSIADLVAPIALYPDQLLGQLLIVASNPQEVLDLGNWLITNQSMKPSDAPAAAKAAGFSTSAQYLAAFPQVVDNMCQQMDWTTQLGDAFKTDQQGVMNAIQAKRLQAQQQGNLKSSPQMTVDTATDNGKQVVQIKPADPQVVYVPQYNPETVYTQPAPAQTTTVVEQQQSGVSTGTAVAIGLLSFGVGMAVGSAFHNDDYYPYPSWGYGGMYYGGHPYPPPPYRPPYYPGYRPAGGYYPPNNYRWSSYNRNVNVQTHNNYYSRYSNNRSANNGYIGNRPGNNNFRGQSTYLGARNDAGRNGPPGSSMARVNPAIANNGGRNEPGRAGGGFNGNAGRGPENRPENNRAMSRSGSAAANRPAAANNRSNSFGGNSRGGDRGFGGNGSPQSRGGNQGAFGGGNSNGPSARQDSNRGRQSMGSPGGGGGARSAPASRGAGGAHGGGSGRGGGRHR